MKTTATRSFFMERVPRAPRCFHWSANLRMRNMFLIVVSVFRIVPSITKFNLWRAHRVMAKSLMYPASYCVRSTLGTSLGLFRSLIHAGRYSRFLSTSKCAKAPKGNAPILLSSWRAWPFPEPGPPASQMPNGFCMTSAFCVKRSTISACSHSDKNVSILTRAKPWRRSAHFVTSLAASAAAKPVADLKRPSSSRMYCNCWSQSPPHGKARPSAGWCSAH
mmetsp:Transcript_19492/g.58338  ORF Transcript_19492/g.58338 Transcript_19492/m.58338 type:complete len:220 (-) Transcript_19492:163-822(-)